MEGNNGLNEEDEAEGMTMDWEDPVHAVTHNSNKSTQELRDSTIYYIPSPLEGYLNHNYTSQGGKFTKLKGYNDNNTKCVQ